MRDFLLLVTFLTSLISQGQSILLTPNKNNSNSDSSSIIIGRDTLVSKNYKVLVNNNDTDVSPTIGIVHNSIRPLEGVWNLQDDKRFFGMSLALKSLSPSSSKPQFAIRMPHGNVTISNSGDLQLGLTNNDTSHVNLSITNNRSKIAFTNSLAAIGLAQKIQSVVTEEKLNEVHGLYSFTDSARFVNNSILAETGSSGQVANIGVFGRIYNTPLFPTANSIAIYGQDDLNLSNTFAGYFNGKVKIIGDVDIVGSISKSAGTFKIDHPLDPYNQTLTHSFVESPEMINIYSGTTNTGADSLSIINLPSYFEALNEQPRYQLTVIGQFAQAIIKETVINNSFTIKTNMPNVDVSWQIIGTRKDLYARENPIIIEGKKIGPEKGTLLYQPKETIPTKSQNRTRDYIGTVKL